MAKKGSGNGSAGAKAMHAKHGKGHQTTAQLAAERANLAKARANVSHKRSKASPAQLAALAAGRAKADAKGRALSAKQLAADRANLAKARAVEQSNYSERSYIYAYYYATHPYTYSSSSSNGSGTRSYTRSNNSKRPLGGHLIRGAYYHHQTIRKPTGINHKMKRRISPTSFDTRASWHLARSHHFQKRLHLRRPKTLKVKHWRRHGGHWTPQ